MKAPRQYAVPPAAKAQKNIFGVLNADCDFVTAAHAIIAGGLKRRSGLDIQKTLSSTWMRRR